MMIGLITKDGYWHLFAEDKMGWWLDPAKFANVEEFIQKTLKCGWAVYCLETGQVW